jgi:hypothetical protein
MSQRAAQFRTSSLVLVVKQQGKAKMVQLYTTALKAIAAACSLAVIYMLFEVSTGSVEREPRVLMRRTSADDPIFQKLDERHRPQESASGWWRSLPCPISLGQKYINDLRVAIAIR